MSSTIHPPCVLLPHFPLLAHLARVKTAQRIFLPSSMVFIKDACKRGHAAKLHTVRRLQLLPHTGVYAYLVS